MSGLSQDWRDRGQQKRGDSMAVLNYSDQWQRGGGHGVGLKELEGAGVLGCRGGVHHCKELKKIKLRIIETLCEK